VPDVDIKSGEEVLARKQILPDSMGRAIQDQALTTSVAIAKILHLSKTGRQIPFASATVDGAEHEEELSLYRCLFGRDSLIISHLMRNSMPHLTPNSVMELGEHQGSELNPQTEEEPGRIPHEVRESDDPIAVRLQETNGWRFPYYGSVDATLLWLTAACSSIARGLLDHSQLCGDVRLEVRIERAVGWVLTRLERHSGFICSERSGASGIENQVWKDSGDSYMHSDGTLARSNARGSVETMAEAFDALVAVADGLDASHFSFSLCSSSDLRRSAEQVRRHLLSDLWLGDRFALGWDYNPLGTMETLDSMTSNQGRLLNSRILEGEAHRPYVEAIVEAIMDPSMLGRSGLRTLSANHVSYRPGGYHTGSAWPFDGALVAEGLMRHGFHREAHRLFAPTAVALRDVKGYPEFLRGDAPNHGWITTEVVDIISKETGHRNRVCQPPQLVQGWTVAAAIWSRDFALSEPMDFRSQKS